MTERKKTDWEAIEADYRAGVKTLRQIATEQGITHGAVRKRAARDGWVRDIAAKVRAKAEELVSKSEVSRQVSTDTSSLTERETIDSNATLQAQIIIAERRDVQAARTATANVWAEFIATSDEISKDESFNVAERLKLLETRSRVIQRLSDAIRTQIDIERRVFRIDDKEEIKDALKSMLDRIAQGNFSTLPVVEEA